MIADTEARGSRLRNASFELLQYDYLSGPPAVAERNVRMLLGSDEIIGKSEGTPEQRVGLTPPQVRQLIDFFDAMDVWLNVTVIRGAGDRAGHGDAEYQRVGCRIVGEDEVGSLRPPHLLLSLKEPSPYEGQVPGPFLRLGALHWPLYDGESGLHQLLSKRNAAAIFDGGGIDGSGAHFLHGGYASPIVSTMGFYAGEIGAADVIGRYCGAQPLATMKVVVGGGGAAGLAAASNLVGKCAEVVVIEFDDIRAKALRALLNAVNATVGGNRTRIRVETADLVETAATEIAGAAGAILCLRVETDEAKALLSTEALRTMAPGAVVVDIPIDQGGSIVNTEIRADSSVVEKIRFNTAMLEGLGLVYSAEVNMPRRRASDASFVHGAAILPYAAALLALCAEMGDVDAVARSIARRKTHPVDSLAAFRQEPRLYRELILDELRKGLAFTSVNGAFEIQNGKIAVHKLAARFRQVADEAVGF
jgi:alanine dehydrogenase